jgi:hypothetical protein
MDVFNGSKRNRTRTAIVLFSLLGAFTEGRALAERLPQGVERVCAIKFDQDPKRPARVEDSALSCLNEAADRLNRDRALKLALVASADPVRDHAEQDHGIMRKEEDPTGADIRFEDIAMYRAINTKDYLARWNKVEPARILPTTNEHVDSQEVIFYLVPGDASFVHNYLGTTKTNERLCTVKPCYDPREESLTPQPRSRIRGVSVVAGKR